MKPCSPPNNFGITHGGMVKGRAAHSGAIRICFRRALFLAGPAHMAIHGAGSDRGPARAPDSRAGFGACAQERVARDFWPLWVYAQSALFGIAADGAGI